MKLRQLYPGIIDSSPERGIQELMRGILVRTNFVPGVRHVIGWRGLKETFTSVEGWTAKIKGFSGVFGMYYDVFDKSGDWLNAQFALLYFPDSQEELVEQCSLKAGAYTQQEDYLLQIRDFLRYPQLCELFNIGNIELGINKAGNALLLGMESISHQRLIAKDGVTLPRGGRTVKLIAPGGYDQNFPAYFTAQAFYYTLAASFTFNLETPPAYMRYLRRTGKETVYDAAGRHWNIASDDSDKESLYLGYGNADFETIIDATVNKAVPIKQDVSWKKGQAVLPEYENALWWRAHQISDYKTLDKKILGIDDRPQLIVLSGFLGAGKTSFLQNFIEYQIQRNRFVAIIQNEIGEIGLDGKLLDHDYSVTEIDEGCVCCSLVGNLKQAIRQILGRFHPDYIVLETTGLANPFNLLDEMSEVAEWVRFDSVTTVVDGLNLEPSLARSEVVRHQIEAADVILLNKKDLLSPSQLQKLRQQLRALNANAPILATAHGDIDPALLYSADLSETESLCDKKQRRDQIRDAGHAHGKDGLGSLKISFTQPLDRGRFLEAIQSAPGGVFRIKGVLEFTDCEMPQLFQYVGGRFEFFQFDNPNLTQRFLTVIGQGLAADSAIQDHFKEPSAGSP